MKPLCVRGGKANDITNELLSLPKETKFENIMFVIDIVTVLIIRQFFNNDVTSPYISACII
jgi:hypothetical protein